MLSDIQTKDSKDRIGSFPFLCFAVVFVKENEFMCRNCVFNGSAFLFPDISANLANPLVQRVTKPVYKHGFK